MVVVVIFFVYRTVGQPSIHIAGGLPTTSQSLVRLSDIPHLQIDLLSPRQDNGQSNTRFGGGNDPVYAASIVVLVQRDEMGGRRG